MQISKAMIKMSQQIPHFWLPVGDIQNDQDRQAILCRLYDTGAVLNIGDLY